MQKEIAKKQYVLYGRYKYECSQLKDKAMESKIGIEEKLGEVNETLAKCKAEKGSKIKVHKKLLKWVPNVHVQYQKYTLVDGH